ncbi:pyridoxamine 5'-phosphate oxidase family protein [Sneathiella marina]|uniref:Pyridoxamine 5'-phosphate oxidase family protein n=1 Tax=Sneathiella marina TaxID=2950108 RepID=A0ABY4WD65_9PROT|nr:pyridoxamine 5'-phosphate oxidase family protein [Sneathiella marina]USG62576.1 pyridoxamine 5'-phosphate oxidase family protein [Sneathiella marina]
MHDTAALNQTISPFHPGEQELQSRAGKREMMEKFGRRAIRTYMPDQHRDFFAKLPFLVVGNVDETGSPWVSILSGHPGFLSSPEPTILQVNSAASKGDPLTQSLTRTGAPLGLLGIEMMTRRRNRMNGRISETKPAHFSVTVDQSFGNCPQYIQNRSIDFVRDPDTPLDEENVETFTSLDPTSVNLITNADTFFVSSYLAPKDQPEIEGVDVSHRGGMPGFVKVEENILTIPDYPGNYHFNTFGNFLLNPKAGLTFLDFSTGDLLMLTGGVELLWDHDETVTAVKGSERAWRFTLDHGIRLKNALPFRARFFDYSTHSEMTGTWAQADALKAAEAKREEWRPYRLARIKDESSEIRSFYFEPADGHSLLPFEAGQFLTLRLTTENNSNPALRTYTVSSAPGEDFYRISVKREDEGQISRYLHDRLKPGDIIEAKAPRGDFFIDPAETRPAVLLAGGVGITPMMSMALHVVSEGVRTRHMRPLTIFHSARTTKQRAFYDLFKLLQQQTEGIVTYYSFISNPATDEKPGVDFNGSGRIHGDAFRQALGLDDYDFYLCGPPAFMQAMYDTLRGLAVRDSRIFAEAFGPASLARQPDGGATMFEPEAEAEQSVITFAASGFEQRWNAGDATLLETAESHGLFPAFSCRDGKCGSCATKIKSGNVAYRIKPTASVAKDEVLLCCSVPAKGSDNIELDL